MNKEAAHKPRGHSPPPNARGEKTGFTVRRGPARHFATSIHALVWSLLGERSRKWLDEDLSINDKGCYRATSSAPASHGCYSAVNVSTH